jgi:hypothetical protein
MGYEVEVKYRTDRQVALAARPAALGASDGGAITQEDAYLSHPAASPIGRRAPSDLESGAAKPTPGGLPTRM